MQAVARSSLGALERRGAAIACIAEIAVLVVMCWFQLDMSTQWNAGCFDFLSTMAPEFMLLSVLTLAAVFCVAYAVCGSLTASGVVLVLLSTGVAVANYYVVKFHGNPLSFLELSNVATAANVMGSYSLEVSGVVVGILGLGAAGVAVSAVGLRAMQKRQVFGRRSWLRSAGVLAAAAAVVFVGYAAPFSVKPAHALVWNWTWSYPYYGYVPCTVDTLQTCFNPVDKPAGYSEEALAAAALPDRVEPSAAPDIVLVLNETFYDLHQVADFVTDTDYLQHLDSLDGAQTGYAVVPAVGGGTNKSEYELLTGNSMAPLAQHPAPFFALDMNGAASLVSLLAAQGYETTAAHPDDPVNYSRNVAYPAMGFDHVYFEDAFQDLDYARGRPYETDESTYANVIRFYEQNLAANRADGKDRPQFVYCLTMQNHGDWDRSPSAYDTVHAQGDFSDLAYDVDEYLTGIAESDAAFANLVGYFAQSDRPTIVCMVGDHAPSFAADIADEQAYDQDDLDLLLRSTPYVVWANFDLAGALPERLSMNFLAPALAQKAGVGLSPYYAYETDLMRDYPVIGAYGCYYDARGARYGYDTDPNDRVTTYRYLDYANIVGEGDPSLFRW